MRVRLAKKPSKPQRGGFTLIELLVVISIIAVLASLILPGVQNARETARRTQCMSNMRNLGLAAVNYATTYNGALPPLLGGKDIYINSDLTSTAGMPWTVHLLPFLDQSSLYDQLTTPAASYTGTHNTLGIPVFNCPSDLSANQPGALSFVANAGYTTPDIWAGAATETNHKLGTYEWTYRTATAPSNETVGPNTEASAKASAAFGVFWKVNRPGQTSANKYNSDATNLSATLDGIRDGTTQTIMFSENVSNGGWLPANRTLGNLGFAAIVPAGGVIGMGAGNVGADGFAYATANQVCKINNNLTAATGSAPRPSSFHPQAVNVVMCDGSARVLSQSIADSVYVRLITPNGNMYGQAILDGNAF